MQPGSGVSAAGGRDSQAPGHAAVLSEELLPGLLHPTGVLPAACRDGRLGSAGQGSVSTCAIQQPPSSSSELLAAFLARTRERERGPALPGSSWGTGLLLAARAVPPCPGRWGLGAGTTQQHCSTEAGAPCGWFPCSALKFPAFVSPLAAASVKYSFNRERVLCWR